MNSYLAAVDQLIGNHRFVVKTTDNTTYIKGIRGPSPFVIVPRSLTTDLAYLVGLFYGDGHLKPTTYKLCLTNVNKQYLEEFVQPLFDKTFSLDLAVREKRNKYPERQTEWKIDFSNKFIYLFFNEVFELPRGDKARIIQVPKIIQHSSSAIQCAFIAGVFDADGGARQKGIRLTTASKEFQNGIYTLLSDLGFKIHCDKWLHKLTNRYYYGVWLSRSESIRFINKIPLKIESKWTIYMQR